MIEDDIIKGIRETRAAFAEKHGFDVQAMGAALRPLKRRVGESSSAFRRDRRSTRR